MSGWSVVRTLVTQEEIAKLNAERQGFRTFLPKYRGYTLRQGRRVWRALNVFPGYLFCFIDDAWYSLRGTRGVIDVIMDGSRPAMLREREMNYLQDKFDEIGTRALNESRFQHGQPVRALAGPLQDQIGLFDGMDAGDRVRVLFSMMGRQVPVELGERELVAA